MENGTQAGAGALGFSAGDSDAPTNPINDLATQDESRLAALAGASDMPPGTSGGASIAQMLAASPHLLKIGNQTQKAMKANPALAAQPMGWARALVGAGMDALAGGGLGDAAAASEKPAPPGAGWLSGVTQTMKARSDRKMAERKEQSEEQTQQLLRAETMQRIAMNTRNIYKQEKQDRNSEYTQNDQYMKTLRTKYSTTEDQDNITQDQLNDFVKKNPNFWKTHTGRAVGEEPVMENGKQKLDKDGNPVFSPLYSISNTAGSGERTAPLSAAESKYIKDNTGENLPEGTQLTVERHDNVMSRADAAHSARQKVEKANDEDLSAQQARELSATMNDPSIQRYMAMKPGEPIGGLYDAKKNVEAHISSIDSMVAAVQKKQPGQPGQPNPVLQALQQKRQQFLDEDTKINKALSGFNEKAMNDYTVRKDKEAEDAETRRHNMADEANKAAELKIKQGGFTGDPNAVTPEAFLASLDPQAKTLVQLIGTGRAPLNNPSYLLARKPEVMEAVSKAYPDVDLSKIKSYQDTYADYTKGKTSGQLKSGVTALKHLGEAMRLNTATSHIPGTPSYNAYENKIDTLSTELASFYGDSTVPAIASIKKTLMATLPGNRGAAIQTQAESMIDRLNTLRDAWTAAAPSKEYEAQMPMGLASMVAQKNAIAAIAGKPELAAPHGATNPSQPGLAADKKTQVWQMPDGSIQDSAGRKYNPQTGQPQ